MSLLTIEIKNNEDFELILSFAKRLNAVIIDISAPLQKKNIESAVSYLDKIAQKGGVSEITDPSEWQREIRTNKI